MGFGKRFKRMAKKTVSTGLKVATSKAGMAALGAMTGGVGVVGVQALKGLSDTSLASISKNPQAGALLGQVRASVSAPSYSEIVKGARKVKDVVDDEIEETSLHAAYGVAQGASDGIVGTIKRILFGG